MHVYVYLDVLIRSRDSIKLLRKNIVEYLFLSNSPKDALMVRMMRALLSLFGSPRPFLFSASTFLTALTSTMETARRWSLCAIERCLTAFLPRAIVGSQTDGRSGRAFCSGGVSAVNLSNATTQLTGNWCTCLRNNRSSQINHDESRICCMRKCHFPHRGTPRNFNHQQRAFHTVQTHTSHPKGSSKQNTVCTTRNGNEVTIKAWEQGVFTLMI